MSTTCFRPVYSTAPSTIGISIRNEKRAAASRVSPRKRLVEIVMPERDTPGIRARISETPIASVWRNVRSRIS